MAKLNSERSREETIVCRKMDKILVAKQEADKAYEK